MIAPASIAAMALWALSILAQGGIFFFFHAGGGRRSRAVPEAEVPPGPLPGPLPHVAMIVPLSLADAAASPGLETALRSLIEQEYPDFSVCLATHGNDDPTTGPATGPAAELAAKLAAAYARVRHVEAGEAAGCSQKNRNLLDALDHVHPGAAVYVFCDASHRAEPGFLRALIAPIIRGRARFSSGYRLSRLNDHAPATVAFHAINRLLLLLQGIPFLTQPWGGALAADAAAFRELGVRELWARTVVDDSSLAGLLARGKERVVFAPAALVRSEAKNVTPAALGAWWLRQLQYPKFYTPLPWLGIGALLAWFGLTLSASLAVLLSSLVFAVPGIAVPGITLAAAAHVGLAALCQELLRRRIAPSCSRREWLAGLGLAAAASYAGYARAAVKRDIVWRGVRYVLDREGRVLSVEKTGREAGGVW